MTEIGKGYGSASREVPILADPKRKKSREDCRDKHRGKSHKLDGHKGDVEQQGLLPSEPTEEREITVGPDEHWTSGRQFPVRVFEAFRLYQDLDDYQKTPREEIHSRNLVRLGQFISDYLQICDAYCSCESKANGYEELKSQYETLQKSFEEIQGLQVSLTKRLDEYAHKEVG